MPIVNLKITEGARRAEKAQIVAEFTETLRRVLGIGSEQIHVVIEEVDEANWGLGGLLTDEYRGSSPAAVYAHQVTPNPSAPPPAVRPVAPPPTPVPGNVAMHPALVPPPPAPLFVQTAPAQSVAPPPPPQPAVSQSFFAPTPVEVPPAPPPAPAPAANRAPVAVESDPNAPPARVMIERTPGAREEEIYVDMVSGGFACLRSVMAENMGREIFRIVENMPESETWKYGPGALVRVKKQKLSTGKAWVAYEEVFPQEVR